MHPAQAFQRPVVLADLDLLQERYPDLTPLVDLYRDIDRIQARIVEEIATRQPPLLSPPLPMAWAQAMLDAGRPLLTFDDIALADGQVAHEVAEMQRCLEQHGVHAAAESQGGGESEGKGESEEPTPGAFLAWARQGFELRAGPTDAPYQHSLTGLAVGQVLVAYLRAAVQGRLVLFDPTLWYRGHCPLCGGRPDMALLDRETGQRTLVCGRCDTLWPYRRVGCPFCGDDSAGDYFASEQDDFRVYRCDRCSSYLKQIRWPTRESLRSLLGLRLLTIGLDLETEAGSQLAQTEC